VDHRSVPTRTLYQRTINPGSSTLKEALDAYDWPHFMEVQLEFLDGDSTIIHCKYNNHVYKEIKKLCGTCHRPKPYHHAGFKEKTKRKRKDKKRKIKDTYTNFHTNETRSCMYQLIGWCDKQEECQLRHDKMVPWETIGCALPRANERVLTRLGLPADAIVCKAGGYKDDACTTTLAGRRTPMRKWSRPSKRIRAS
tara:strand:- start:464 stop:1051 length:588 start_codon:yes stop_codon:yes gene_type:complete